MQNSGSGFIGQVLGDRDRIEKQLGQKTGRRTFLAIEIVIPDRRYPTTISLLDRAIAKISAPEN